MKIILNREDLEKWCKEAKFYEMSMMTAVIVGLLKYSLIMAIVGLLKYSLIMAVCGL